MTETIEMTTLTRLFEIKKITEEIIGEIQKINRDRLLKGLGEKNEK